MLLHVLLALAIGAEGGSVPSALDVELATVRSTQSLVGGVVGGGSFASGFSYAGAAGPEKGLKKLSASTSLMRYASTAKSFVGVVAAFLAADGVVDLDLPITTYYAAFPTPTK